MIIKPHIRHFLEGQKYFLSPLLRQIDDDFFHQEPVLDQDALINVYDQKEKNQFQIYVLIPGLEKQDIDIQATDRSLIIEFEKEFPIEDKKVRLQEIPTTRKVRRQIPLPHRIDENSIQAEYQNGLLILSLNKKEKEQKKINVQGEK